MSFSLFQKVRIIGLGDAHEILNATIDLNSPAAVGQLVRDIESAEAKIGDALAQNKAEQVQLEQALAGLHRQHDQMNLDATTLVRSGKEDSAKQVLIQIDRIEQQIAPKENQLQGVAATRASLQQTLSILQAKRQTMLNHQEELASMASEAAGKERAASALKAAGSIAGGMDGAGIDDISARAQQRLNLANAKLEQASGAITSPVEDDLAAARAQERLDAMKAQLGATAAR